MSQKNVSSITLRGFPIAFYFIKIIKIMSLSVDSLLNKIKNAWFHKFGPRTTDEELYS